MTRLTHGLLCLLALPLLAATTGCRPTTTWSPDGQRLALDPYGFLYTFDLATRKFQQRTQGPQRAMNPAWHPDGQKIAYFQSTVKDGAVTFLALNQLDLSTGKHTRLVNKLSLAQPADVPGELKLNFGNVEDLVRMTCSASWSPDGKRLAYSGPSGEASGIWVAEANGAGAVPLLPEGRSGFDPVWSPDGSHLVYLGFAMEEPEPGAAPQTRSPDLEVVRPDGSGRRVLWNARERGPLAALGPSPRWSADGKSVLVLVDGEKKADFGIPDTCALWSIPVDGGEPRQVAPIPGPSPFATLTPHATAMTFFFAPRTPDESVPTLGVAAAPFAEPKSLHRLDRKLVGIAEGEDVDRFPIPDISPDGKHVAVAIIPKKSPATLLLAGTGGEQLERIPIPRPVVPTVKKPAPKKPEPRKAPVRKAPTRRPKR